MRPDGREVEKSELESADGDKEDEEGSLFSSVKSRSDKNGKGGCSGQLGLYVSHLHIESTTQHQ